MVKKAIIIHGWDGNPDKGWFKWLKKELERREYKVIMPKMPNPESPKIGSWLKKFTSITKNIDDETILIGHSVGCQTILRFLEKSRLKKAGRIIFVAGWLELKEFAYKENPEYEKEVRKIAKQWIESKMDFNRIRRKLSSISYIISDDDPYVALKNAYELKKRLGGTIIKQHGKGHYVESETKSIPIIMKMIG